MGGWAPPYGIVFVADMLAALLVLAAAAVAAFGQKLKGSAYGETITWQEIMDLANGAKGADVNGYRAEFVQMVGLAALLNPDHSAGGKSKFGGLFESSTEHQVNTLTGAQYYKPGEGWVPWRRCLG